MRPEETVACLVKILAARPEFTEEEVYAAMANAGIPDDAADRAYKFTQIAWGQVLLDDLGVKSTEEYICLNGAGEAIESGRLERQPHFAAALAVARRHPPPPGLRRFALMSADVSAVDSAIRKGSRLEDLAMGPAALFMEQPSEAGLEKARRRLRKKLSRHSASPGASRRARPSATATAASSGQVSPGPAHTAMPSWLAFGSVLVACAIFLFFRATGWHHLSLADGGWGVVLAALLGVGLGALGISRRRRSLHPRLTLALGILGILMNFIFF